MDSVLNILHENQLLDLSLTLVSLGWTRHFITCRDRCVIERGLQMACLTTRVYTYYYSM